jgi:uncharacterized protein
MAEKTAVVAPKRDDWVKTHPAVSYFVFTFAISWGGALAVITPKLLRGESIPKFTGLMLFPVLLLGPLIAGVGMAAYVDGRRGLKGLFGRAGKVGVMAKWYAVLFIPPVLILSVLTLLRTFMSPSFAPNWFLAGMGFGVIAGFVEELGWTGFAFPTMAKKTTALWTAITLGLLWSLWHIPVIDYLGTATPHGSHWLSYFLCFTAAMTAMRVLICWAYLNTGSVLLAQLMHMVSTGSLVVLGPARVTAAEEALWYGAYGLALWLVVAIVVSIYGRNLTGTPAHA